VALRCTRHRKGHDLVTHKPKHGSGHVDVRPRGDNSSAGSGVIGPEARRNNIRDEEGMGDIETGVRLEDERIEVMLRVSRLARGSTSM
jgi:hypothetical protein